MSESIDDRLLVLENKLKEQEQINTELKVFFKKYFYLLVVDLKESDYELLRLVENTASKLNEKV